MLKCECGNLPKKGDTFCSKCGEKVKDECVPEMLPESERNYTSLERSVKSDIDEIVRTGRIDEDNAQYMYEEVMRTFYGKNIFNWIRENTD